MKHWKLAGSTAALALFSGAAAAQVTPEEVWQNWQDMSASYGQTLTSDSAARDGDALVVTNLAMESSQDGTTIKSVIPEVRFTDTGDGTVEITMTDSYAMTVDTAAAESAPASSAEITIAQPGMSVIASGTPEATDYAFTAPDVKITLTKVDGADAVAAGADVSALLVNVSGHYLVEGVEGGEALDSEFAADSLAINVKAKNPDDGSDVVMTASVTAPAGKATGNFVGLENEELAAALDAGFATEVSLSYGAVSYDLSVTEATGPTQIKGSSQGGSLEMALDTARLLLATSGKGVQIAMSGPEIPLPQVSLSYAESAFTFLIPVVASEDLQDFTMLAKIVDLSVPEDLWGMVDPVGQLPHDPATVIIDTKGKVKLTTDIMDEAAMAALGEVPPGEIHALDITEIKASVAGAELTGAGAFTFDNSDTVTYGGAPAPTGKIDLKLTGGNTLLDKLVAMGLLTEDDAMGARMMVSMFANQGAGADDLTSSLEFKDKHFYANGQQIQ